MQLINPSFEIIPQQEGIDGINKIIEIAGRTCYKSEDKIYDYTIGDKKYKASDIIPVEFEDVKASLNGGTLATYTKEMSAEELYEYQNNTKQDYGIRKESAAKEFVQRMIDSGHGAMLEHGTVYLIIDSSYTIGDWETEKQALKYVTNKYSKVYTNKELLKSTSPHMGNTFYITTNLRVIMQGSYDTYDEAVANKFDKNWLSDLQYLCEPTEYHEKRVTVKLTSNIHFYKDTTRHRVFSWAIESTRYCNYIKNKFGGNVSFSTPIWLVEEDVQEFEKDLETIESIYFKWINRGWTPEKAAYFLIQGTKADIVMTGFVSDYKHFFNLRVLGTTGKPHPTVEELAKPLMNKFKQLKLISHDY